MKFIRDIIADKRDQAPSQAEQVVDDRSDHDVMASILTESGPAADPFHLDDSFQVSDPQVDDAETHIQSPESAESSLSQAPTADLKDWNTEDRADIEGLDLSAFAAPVVPPQPTPDSAEQADPLSDLSDFDFQRLAASTAAEEEPPQDRPFKRFTRTQTRLHTPETDMHEEQATPADKPVMRPTEAIRQPASPPQHPAPIRQKANPVAPPPVAPTPVDRAPVSSPPVDRTPQMAPPETPVQPTLREQAPQVEPARPDPAQPIDVPSPAMGRGSSKAGRVKTRLLGFNSGQAAGADPFARKGDTADTGYTQYPVGWLAIVSGPGRGATFTLFSGVTIIGRGEDQTVRLDFGDNSISRTNHAAIAFDAEQNTFFIGHGGKANLVRRNNRPVLSTEELAMGDLIRIGETTLRFVPLCGPEFGWNDAQQSEAGHAS